MKTKLVVSIGLFLLPLLSLAQEPNKSAPGFFIIIKATASSKEIITKNSIIDASDIADIRVLPIEEVEKRFGKLKEVSLVAEVTLKPGIKFSTLEEFYKKHSINGNRRKLPFVINGENKTDTTNLIIAEKSLKVVNIRTDSIQIMTNTYFHYLEDLKKPKVVDNTKINN